RNQQRAIIRESRAEEKMASGSSRRGGRLEALKTKVAGLTAEMLGLYLVLTRQASLLRLGGGDALEDVVAVRAVFDVAPAIVGLVGPDAVDDRAGLRGTILERRPVVGVAGNQQQAVR